MACLGLGSSQYRNRNLGSSKVLYKSYKIMSSPNAHMVNDIWLLHKNEKFWALLKKLSQSLPAWFPQCIPTHFLGVGLMESERTRELLRSLCSQTNGQPNLYGDDRLKRLKVSGNYRETLSYSQSCGGWDRGLSCAHSCCVLLSEGALNKKAYTTGIITRLPCPSWSLNNQNKNVEWKPSWVWLRGWAST